MRQNTYVRQRLALLWLAPMVLLLAALLLAYLGGMWWLWWVIGVLLVGTTALAAFL